MKRIIFLFVCAVVISLVVQESPEAVTFTVTDTTDSGPGSLRDAISLANLPPPTADTILFNIPLCGLDCVLARAAGKLLGFS